MRLFTTSSLLLPRTSMSINGASLSAPVSTFASVAVENASNAANCPTCNLVEIPYQAGLPVLTGVS